VNRAAPVTAGTSAAYCSASSWVVSGIEARARRSGSDTGPVTSCLDDQALHRTLSSGRTTFWSRSRREYWVKGETSGHRQWVKEVRLDCDGDSLLVKVDQEGPACHTGARSCFDDGLLGG
jgi:phosphoribosyl-AMP cyclohydrolase